MNGVRLLIAGGGTGGHFFPALAVASEFMAMVENGRVLFVGTERGIEARKAPEAGFDLAVIRSAGIAGTGGAARIKAVATVPLSVLDAVRVVRRFKPHVALGVGGYVSGPAVLAAWLMRVPCAIQEQNAEPGATNKILGRLAQKVFLGVPAAADRFASARRRGRVVVSGNPVRREITRAILEAGKAAEKGRGEGKAKVLVVGGSQGAKGLNRLMIEAMAAMDGEARDSIELRHQTGESAREEVVSRYKEIGLEAKVDAFINDMAGAYAWADVIVSRAGAGAAAEIALAGLPSILVPFPHATADHQARNAQALVAEGAALMFRESEIGGAELAEALIDIIRDKEKRGKMSQAARRVARPEAARTVVEGLLELAKSRDRAAGKEIE